MLDQHGLIAGGRGKRMDREGRAARRERGRVRLRALVHDVNDRDAVRARPRERAGDLLRGGGPLRQHHLAERREVFLLSVDDDEGSAVHLYLSAPGPSLKSDGTNVCGSAGSVRSACCLAVSLTSGGGI